MTTPIAIVGVGKIARDQHIPTIAAHPDFHLAGAVSRHANDLGVPTFATLTELKAAVPELAAIAVCTPPVDRLALVEEACALGLDILMEKPPAATLSEAERFAPVAERAGRVLFLSWHSRAAAAVDPARKWLADARIRRVRIDWLEDVRVWHPGQEWIWSPGIGVFDPGINSLSILTHILPSVVTVNESELRLPANRDAPIEARLRLDASAGHPVDVHFSFDQKGPQTWSITVETDDGVLELHDGGSRMVIDGADQPVDDRPEYARLYDHFAHLLAARRSDTDLSPFRVVADAYLLGRQERIGAFDWNG